MALTTYPGVTVPSFASYWNSFYRLVQDNTGQTLPSATLSLQGSGRNQAISKGSIIVVGVFIPDTTTVVNSISTTGLTGITFSRLSRVVGGTTRAVEVWVGTASASYQFMTALSANMSASISGAIAVGVADSVSSVSLLATAGANSTTQTLTAGSALTGSNQVVVTFEYTGSGAVAELPLTVPAGVNGTVQSILGGRNVYANQVLGSGITPSYIKTYSPAADFAAIMICLNGPTVQLDDNTYLARDDGTGVLLNDPNVSSGIMYDVQSVVGLSDSNTNSSVDQIDGADGSYLTAKYLTGKTVVLSGIIYGGTPFDESLNDNLKNAYRPSQDDSHIPFFYKLFNKTVRVLYVKGLAYKADMDRSRALSSVPFQIQVGSSDVRSYSPKVSLYTGTPITGSTYQLDVTPNGNIETFPVIYFNKYTADGTTADQGFTFNILRGTKIYTIFVNINPTAFAGFTLSNGAYKLDFATRRLARVAGTTPGAPWDNENTGFALSNVSGNITSSQWVPLQAGQLQRVQMIRPAASTVTNDGFTIVYADAWR